MSVSRHLLSLLRFSFILLLFYRGSFASTLTCPRLEVAGVVDAIRSPKCPLWIERSFPYSVNGDDLDKVLAHVQDGSFYSVFFHTSKCPFSQNFKSTFDTLSSMFPKIIHLAIEESSTMPSIFSRYGVHSFPTLLLSNKTERIRYRGSKDLDSLVRFYREFTGEEPVAYFYMHPAKRNSNALHPWRGTIKEFMKNEPYLSVSLMFIILRALIFFFPIFIFKLKTLRAWFARFHVDIGIFSGLNQILGRALHVIYGLSSKTGNFRKGVKSARVWASSLASSVSLGESSSSRAALLDS